MINSSGSSTSSGLDVASIVSQLMAVERRPLAQMQQREDAIKSRITAYGTLKSGVSSLADAVRALAKPATFSAFTGKVDEAGVAAVSVSSNAVAASYDFEVAELAGNQKLASGRVASSSTDVGSGTINIEFGRYDSGGNTFTANADKPAFSVAIGSGAKTLADVRSAINAANKGVTASIINDGSGSRLVLTSNDTGEVNGLRISVTDDDGNNTDAAGLSALAFDPTVASGPGRNLTQLSAATNASLTIDGLPITSASNQLTTAIDGVTISLTGTTSGPARLTVGRDTAAISTSIQGFVKAYNDLNKTTRDLTFVDTTAKSAGKLQGDSSVLMVQSRLRALVTESSADAASPTQRLSDVGIAMQKDGSLVVDQAKLDKALASDLAGVVSLFDGTGTTASSIVVSTGGIAGKLNTLLQDFLNTDGVLSQRTSALNASIKRIDEQQSRFEIRMTQVEKRYVQQFSNLDRMLAGMNSLSTFINRL